VRRTFFGGEECKSADAVIEGKGVGYLGIAQQRHMKYIYMYQVTQPASQKNLTIPLPILIYH